MGMDLLLANAIVFDALFKTQMGLEEDILLRFVISDYLQTEPTFYHLK